MLDQSAAKSEKVGVVVIHGVGETKPGWIDSYLVPELEKWSAYNAAGKLDQKKKCGKLALVVRAKDRHIVVCLDDDADFEKFARIPGLETLLEILADTPEKVPKYKLQKDRLNNRDELRRLISQETIKKDANVWLGALCATGVPAAIAFDPQSEVNRVRDLDDSEPTTTWQSFSRRWPLDNRDAILTELYWADLSKVGTTNATRFSAVLQLFLESPFILGRAFLNGSEHGLQGLVRRLVLAANWIMRWPVAGLNVAVFSTCFAVIALVPLIGKEWLPYMVAALLSAVALGGVYFHRRWAHKKVGLADLALAASVYAILLLGALAIAVYYWPPEKLRQPEPYLVVSAVLIIISWLIWTLLTVLAILLVTLSAAKELVFGVPAGQSPVARPAAAVGLNVVLGVVWKFVLSVLGLLVIGTISSDDPFPGSSPCKVYATLQNILDDPPSMPCLLKSTNATLIDIGALNAATIVGILLAVMAVLTLRSLLTLIFHKKAKDGVLKLPRLIASPFILAAIFAGALINAAVVLNVLSISKVQLADVMRAWFPKGSFESFGAGLLGLVVFSFFLRRLLEVSNGVVHIGRDLVDHQYDPDPDALGMRLMRLSRNEKVAAKGEEKPYRRRTRIQLRLYALINEVIAAQHVDRLIFVAHSQGTVILHDYLIDHDNLLPQTQGANELPCAGPVDVVTLGSPLKHIYSHYFRDYDLPKPVEEGKLPLAKKVNSWTNMWRVGDPIGQDVELVTSPMHIENKGIGRGGHTMYWKENRVCEKIVGLIHQPGTCAAKPEFAAGPSLKVESLLA